MDRRLIRQLSLDYCCTEADVLDRAHHFTDYVPLTGRRQFDDECPLKIAVANGKLLCTGRPDLVDALRSRADEISGPWFMDAGEFRYLDALLAPAGFRVKQAHIFFTADHATDVPPHDFGVRWYEQADIAPFRGDDRFGEAFAFSDAAPDKLGVAAVQDGQLIGMAGASADSPLLWQIGVNTLDGHAARGVASALVCMLKNAVLARGFLPYYGTAFSHLASQRVALKAGFLPAWTELITEVR